MQTYIVATTHGAFNVRADNATDARAFAVTRLAERHPGETVIVFDVRTV